MNISQAGIDLIIGSEGFRADSYQDQKNIWTIGYGTTHIGGVPVTEGMVCTPAQAVQWLLADLQYFECQIQDILNVPVTQNQFDALCSLVYNIGPENFRTSSVAKMINQSNYKTAQARFLLWNKIKVKGKYVVDLGLTRRRVREAALFGPLSANELVSVYHVRV